MSYWLPPDHVDPQKLKPRRLDPDEYEMMHTALVEQHKLAEKIGPDKLKEVLGSITVSEDNTALLTDSSIPVSIHRKYADIWGCEDCNATGDKWYMHERRCSRSKVAKMTWLSTLQGQRRAKRIKQLEKENQKIVDRN